MMNDDDTVLERTTSEQLDSLLGVATGEPVGWSTRDLAAMFRHQLAAPLGHDLRVEEKQLPAGVKTFADLLRDPSAPVELLALAKDFAKEADAGRGALPTELATGLYYACLAAGLAHRGKRLSTMEDAQLRKGLQWCADQQWMDEQIKTVVRAALDSL